MEILVACRCGITIPMDQPQSCLLDLQSREENENQTKIYRGSVMRSVRKRGKADGLQHLILMFESSVDGENQKLVLSALELVKNH